MPREPVRGAGETSAARTSTAAGSGMPRQFLVVCGVQQPDDVRIRGLGLLSFHLVANGLPAPALVPVELAPAGRCGSAYGIFTACYGIARLTGSILIGVLYEKSTVALPLLS